MGPFQYVSRLTYAWSAALILLGVPILVAVVGTLVPETLSVVSYVSKACTIVLALLTGGRVAEAGYPYWVGAMPVLVIGIMLPAIAEAALILLDINHELVGIAGSGSIQLLLIAFAIWAGTRKPLPRQDPDDRPVDRRIESHPTGPRV